MLLLMNTHVGEQEASRQYAAWQLKYYYYYIISQYYYYYAISLPYHTQNLIQWETLLHLQ